MMILANKNAVIYGAGGSLGSSIAKAFAHAGARVYLAGRNPVPVQKIVDEILAAGGFAEPAIVDVLDEDAVNVHMEDIVQKAGKIDISFNLAGDEVVQNIPLTQMSKVDFMHPVTMMLLSRFLTAKAAGKQMMKQGSGVIITLTATPGGIGYPYTGGFGVACSALESFSCNLASELGIYGVRVVNIRSAGSPDSRVFKDAINSNPEAMAPILKSMESDTMLKRLPLMADIANTAVFLASEMAGKITGVAVDVTSGTTAGLNYKVSKQAFS